MTQHVAPRPVGLLAGFALLAGGSAIGPVPSAAATGELEQLAVWQGPSGGLWSDPGNWSSPIAPCNVEGVVVFDVVIGLDEGEIVCDVPACEIRSLDLEFGSWITVQAGAELDVTDAALLCGDIVAPGGSFDATTLETSTAEFSCDEAQVFASAGGDVRVDAVAYDSRGIFLSEVFGHTRHWDLIRATGAGSRLDLSGIETIDAGFDDGDSDDSNRQWIRAWDGGTVDLSSVTMTTAPARLEDLLYFEVLGGSTMDLSSLATTTNAGRGRTVFTVDAADMVLPSLTTMEDTLLLATAGGSISVPAAGIYDSRGINLSEVFGHTRHWDLIRATGAGSRLDLSGIETIDAGFNDGDSDDSNRQWIRAWDGGMVDLSSVTMTTAPARLEDLLYFEVLGGSTMDLSSLATTTNAGRGRTVFTVDAADMVLPSLTTMEDTLLLATAGGSISVPAAGIYDSRGINLSEVFGHTRHWDLIRATGAGSRLDLSGIETIDAGFNDGDSDDSNRQWIRAWDGGMVDLSSVTMTTAPARLEDLLYFEVLGGSTMDLSSLVTTTNAGRGRTVFTVDAADLVLPSLTTMEDTLLLATAGGSISVPAAGIYDSRGINLSEVFGHTRHWDLISATGAGSRLDLPGIETIDAGFNDGDGDDSNRQWIKALDGATVRLDAVHTLTVPVRGEDQLRLRTEGAGSSLDLSSLETVVNGGAFIAEVQTGSSTALGDWADYAPPVTIIVSNADPAEGTPASTLRVAGDLRAGSSADIDLTHENTRFDVDGSLFAGAAVDLNVVPGAAIDIGGRLCLTHDDAGDFHVDGATVHLDGAGTEERPQRVEVGGFDLDLICPPDNFALGTLIVGRDDAATVVELRDDSANGGGSKPEVLYLLDPDGLEIRGGSTLVLNELEVYLCADEVRVTELFEEGEDIIAYDEGFIAMGAAPVRGDVNGDGIINFDDLLVILDGWGRCPDAPAGWCPGDLTCDGSIGFDDLLVVIDSWT